MTSMREQMQAAQAYIKLEQYEDARRILKTIDHPKAKEWLVKINEMSPEPPMVGQFYEKDVWDFAFVVIGAMILAGITTVLYYNASAISGDSQSLTTWVFFSLLYAVCIFFGRRKWKQQKEKPN